MTLQALNAARWAKAKLLHPSDYDIPVRRILAAQDRYKQIQTRTGVHWVFIASSHYRESNLNFETQLGQGDPLHKVSVHEPRGRGPFATFEDGAYDALVNCAPYAAKNDNWSMPDLLTVLEAYNGLGYYHKGLPSPYVWSGTDQYTRGKYVADGVFDPNVVDRQLGVAGLIISLLHADPSISFPGGTPAPTTHPELPEQPHHPIPDHPAAKDAPLPPKPSETVFTEIWDWLKKH